MAITALRFEPFLVTNLLESSSKTQNFPGAAQPWWAAPGGRFGRFVTVSSVLPTPPNPDCRPPGWPCPWLEPVVEMQLSNRVALCCMLGEGDAAICPENQEWPFAAFLCAHFWLAHALLCVHVLWYRLHAILGIAMTSWLLS